ncbi:MAG: hypothetical protein R3Y43_00210 [Alphaproteobacteria bacterium]
MKEFKKIKKEFGLQIFKLRQDKKQTLSKVAKDVKVSKDLLEKVELGSGVLDWRMIKVLAKYYNKNVEIKLIDKI